MRIVVARSPRSRCDWPGSGPFIPEACNHTCIPLLVFFVITGGVVGPNVPLESTRSNDIRASYTLSSAGDGTTLFSQAFEFEADWNTTAEEIITYTNRRFARNFPYRN
jgi:hypothetical protein